MPPGTDSRFCGRTCRALAALARHCPGTSPLDDRGQAIGIANFFMAIVLGGVMAIVVTTITDDVLELGTERANDPTANTALSWATEFLTNLPAVWAVTAVMSLIVLSVYQRAILR